MATKIAAKVYKKLGLEKGATLPQYQLPDGSGLVYIDIEDSELCADCAAVNEVAICDVEKLEESDRGTAFCYECERDLIINGFDTVKVTSKWQPTDSANLVAFNTRLAPPVHPHGAV